MCNFYIKSSPFLTHRKAYYKGVIIQLPITQKKTGLTGKGVVTQGYPISLMHQ